MITGRQLLNAALLLLAFSLIAQDVTAEERLKSEAMEALSRLRKVEWGDLQPDYLSVEDACSKALSAMARNEVREADRLFQLAILKGAILERNAKESYPAAQNEADTPAASRLVGDEFYYKVKKSETVRLLAAKFGVGQQNIRRMNHLKKGESLKSGQRLKIVTRRIIPKEIEDGIIVNIPDRTMYIFKDGKLGSLYPIAVGKPAYKGNKGWHTPTGTFNIVGKAKNPVWKVPPSIRDEMRSQGREVLDEVPPGDANPLGGYALRTSIPGILIHGTNLPSSIYGFSSHGCIRVNPANMEQLFRDIGVRTKGEIIYKPVKVAESNEGRIFLEVHWDVYDKVKNLEIEAWNVITGINAKNRVDWEKVMNAVLTPTGMPVDVTLDPARIQSFSKEDGGFTDG